MGLFGRRYYHHYQETPGGMGRGQSPELEGREPGRRPSNGRGAVCPALKVAASPSDPTGEREPGKKHSDQTPLSLPSACVVHCRKPGDTVVRGRANGRHPPPADSFPSVVTLCFYLSFST